MDEQDQDELLKALTTAPETAPVTAADRALLAYALKLTTAPAAMVARDVALLREAGFNDRAIHDAAAITAYFAFANRLADGLGIELEDEEDPA